MGQELVILVSEKLAKEVGMIDLMNFIYRDPENHKNGIYEFQMADHEKTHVVIENIKSHVSYQIKPTNNLIKKPYITIDIKLKGELKEFMKSKRIDKPNILEQVEKEVEKRVVQQGKDLVTSFKKKSIDPLGLGLRYRSKDKAKTPEKWQEIYPDADVQTGISQ